MTPVGAAHGGDIGGVARRGEPVVDGGADTPALDRRIARPVVAGDQQQHAVPGRNRLLKPTVDRLPRAIEVHPVEIEGPSATPFPEGIGALGLSRVMVPPDRADEAKAILAEHSQDPGPELSDTADE